MYYYVNIESCLAVGITFIITSVCALSLRFFTRLRSHGVKADDWLAFVGMIFVVGECSIVIAGAKTDTIGSHSPNLGLGIYDHDDYFQALLKKFNVPFNMLSTFALASLKLSMIFFYRRIFINATFNIATWIITGFTCLWAVVFFIELASLCRNDFSANFASLLVLKTKCADDFAALICLVTFDVLVDLLIIIAPMPYLWKLQMPIKRKFAVSISFLFGMLAIACGITRMTIFIELLSPPVLADATIGGYNADDQNGILSVLLFWGLLEMGVGTVAVCLPALLPMGKVISLRAIHRLFGTIFTMSTRIVGHRPPQPQAQAAPDRRETMWQQDDDLEAEATETRFGTGKDQRSTKEVVTMISDARKD